MKYKLYRRKLTYPSFASYNSIKIRAKRWWRKNVTKETRPYWMIMDEMGASDKSSYPIYLFSKAHTIEIVRTGKVCNELDKRLGVFVASEKLHTGLYCLIIRKIINTIDPNIKCVIESEGVWDRLIRLRLESMDNKDKSISAFQNPD